MKDPTWKALSLAWELGYLIALPAVIFGFTGAMLDKKFSFTPWLTIGGFILAFVISAFAVYRKVKKINT